MVRMLLEAIRDPQERAIALGSRLDTARLPRRSGWIEPKLTPLRVPRFDSEESRTT